MKTLESFLTDCVGSSGSFAKTKCATKQHKQNYNNNNNNNLSDLQQQLQTSMQLQQLQNEQQQQDLKFEASTRNALNAKSEASEAEETNTTIEDNQNLTFTRWWFMLMQQTINYNNYSNILQRPNAAATTTTLPAAFLDELLGNVANIFSSE